MSRTELRIIVTSVFAIAMLLAIVPRHYWGGLLLAIKVIAAVGTAVIMIRQYLRRH